MLIPLSDPHLFSPHAGTRNFYQQLIRYPQEVIPLMDRAVHEVFHALYGELDGGRRIQVRPLHRLRVLCVCRLCGCCGVTVPVWSLMLRRV